MPKLVLYAAAAIIAAAALPLPYGIYVFIRIIGTITFACLAYESWKQGHEPGVEVKLHRSDRGGGIFLYVTCADHPADGDQSGYDKERTYDPHAV